MRSLSLGALLSLSAVASAQVQVDPVPVGGQEPTWVGTVDAITGVLAPAVALRGTSEVLYANNVFLGQFLPLEVGETMIDEGRIPSTGSPSVVGNFDSYGLSMLQVGYATDADGTALGGTGVRLRVQLFEGYSPCAPASQVAAPIATVEFDAPGSASGGLEAFTVNVDVSGLGLCMRADGNGAYSDGTRDVFGWSFEVVDPGVGVTEGTGPLLASDPMNAPEGDATAFQNPLQPAGTGLGTLDLAQVTTPMGASCIFFGGYPANNFTSFWLTVSGDADANGDCIGCGLGDDRFEDNDSAAAATPVNYGLYPGLVCDAEDDWYAVTVDPGRELQIDAFFTTNVADLDLYLYDAATLVELERGFTGTDNERVSYANCSASAVDLVFLIDSFSGNCNEYDLRLSDPALLDDGFEDNDACVAAVPLPLGTERGLVVRRVCSLDPDYFSVTLGAGETLTVDVLFDGATADLNAALLDVTTLGCPGVAVAASNGDDSTEHLTYTNAAAAPVDLVLGIGMVSDGSASYDLVTKITGIETIGELICVGNANSASDGARLCAFGSATALDNNLDFEVDGLPTNVFGFFVVSKEIGFANPATSQGTLCIASLSIGRYSSSVLGSGSTGTMSFSPDVTVIPFSAGGTFFDVAAEAGDTFNFQVWYRDQDPSGGQTSNFSDAISIAFE